MNLDKIGKFIADCRKEAKLTQEQLAEKLYITDRAVSKWERGISLPDVDKMLELCNILRINVNELLNGEKIDMKEYEKKNEKLLLEMARQEEQNNKRLMLDMWVLLITTCLFYIGIITLAALTLEDGPVLKTIICISTVLLVIICFYGLKLETDAGYYECPKCHHKFEERNYFRMMIVPRIGIFKFLKCPKCHKRSMAKKVMTKE